MENTDIRKVLRLWAASDQIERYAYPLIPVRIKERVFVFGIGAFVGFLIGVLILSIDK
jgi:hypothetical protein